MHRSLLLAIPLLLAGTNAAAQETIAPGQSVSGELGASDTTLDDGTYYDVWRFEGVASHRYRVTLRSADFDAVLTVGADIQRGCDDCAVDDDGAGGTDAQVEYVGSQDGTYAIRAYSFDEGATGRYEITLEDQGMDEVVVGTPIVQGEPVAGELARGDRKIPGQSYSDTYAYEGRAGETIRVTLRSEDFDTLLEIGGFDGEECTGMDIDDNGAGGTDSRLTLTLPDDGLYHLHVSSARGGGAGAYTLLVEEAEEVVAVASPIAEGGAVEGRLMEGDPRERDGSLYDLWSFRGRAGESLTITLRSEDFDTFLRFGRTVEGEWDELGYDDDGTGTTDSELTITLPEDGEYLIHANAFGANERGAYTLLVRRN